MLTIENADHKIVVQGWKTINGKLAMVSSFIEEREGEYNLATLRVRITLKSRSLDYIRVFKTTSNQMVFQHWYKAGTNGRLVNENEMMCYL